VQHGGTIIGPRVAVMLPSRKYRVRNGMRAVGSYASSRRCLSHAGYGIREHRHRRDVSAAVPATRQCTALDRDVIRPELIPPTDPNPPHPDPPSHTRPHASHSFHSFTRVYRSGHTCDVTCSAAVLGVNNGPCLLCGPPSDNGNPPRKHDSYHKTCGIYDG